MAGPLFLVNWSPNSADIFCDYGQEQWTFAPHAGESGSFAIGMHPRIPLVEGFGFGIVSGDSDPKDSVFLLFSL